MTESTNMLLQGIAVGFIILVCIIYIVRRATRHRRKNSASCSDCPLADSCHSTSTGKNRMYATIHPGIAVAVATDTPSRKTIHGYQPSR